MHLLRPVCITIVIALCTRVAGAVPVTFTDVNTFRAVAGNVLEIDFDTLPNHRRLVDAVEITPSFNFTAWGVTFSAPESLFQMPGTLGGALVAGPTILGSAGSSFIAADFETPVYAVGLDLSQSTTVSLFDVQDRLVTTLAGGGGPADSFASVLSDVALGRLVGTAAGPSVSFDGILYSVTPEPATIILLALGAIALGRRRGR